jgi:hypothetical protein
MGLFGIRRFAARNNFAQRKRWHTLRALACGVLASALFAAVVEPLTAAEPSDRASTSRAALSDALKTIPLEKIPADVRPRVSAVLNDTSLFRRLPIQVVDCEPEMFQFLESNPDVVVNIWQLMGVTNVKLERVDGNRFRCSDGDGTTARAEIIFRNQDTEIIYAEGLYEGPLFPKPVRGQCVAVIKTAAQKETNGRYYVTARLDTFLHVDNVGVEFLAKVFQGLVGRTIDHNFAETVAFIGSVSRTAETNPQGMQRLAAKLRSIEAERREQFATLSQQVASKLGNVESGNETGNAILTSMAHSAATEVPRPVLNSRR